jgi:FkbM family methyltransferase
LTGHAVPGREAASASEAGCAPEVGRSGWGTLTRARPVAPRPLSSDERSRFYEWAATMTSHVAVDSDGLTFLVPTADRAMGKFFVRGRRKEMRVLAAALARLEAAGVEVVRTTFLDVGANIGTTTLAALRAGFRSVLACEPDPANAKLLRANVALNSAEDTVRILEVAISDRSGVARLDPGRGSRTKSRILGGVDDRPRGIPIEVATVSIDELVRDGTIDPDSIGLLWADVEGHECQVLSGAQTLIERRVPLVIELNPKLIRRAGGSEALLGLLASDYTHVLDLRRPDSAFVPIASFDKLLEDYSPPAFTDLLLFTMPGKASAPGAPK